MCDHIRKTNYFSKTFFLMFRPILNRTITGVSTLPILPPLKLLVIYIFFFLFSTISWSKGGSSGSYYITRKGEKNGNLSLLGSVANLIVCEQARRSQNFGYNLTFWSHLNFGVPSTIIVTAIGLTLIRA